MARQPAHSPTVLRWELAGRLRLLRQEAGRTVEDAAGELMCSAAKISRIETAGRGIQARDVRDLCRYYGVSDQVRDELIRMAHEAKRPGWWNDYRALDEQTTTYVGLESAASAICMLESRVIPGLLQIEAYTRILFPGIFAVAPRPELVEDVVEIRQRRAERIVRGDATLEVLTDMAVFTRHFGRRDVMAEQIEHIIEQSALPNVVVRMLPFDSPAHPGIHTSFAHMSFADRSVSDLIYLENLLSSNVLDRESEVEQYVAAYKVSRERSWPPERTSAWLAEYREDLLDTKSADPVLD